MHEAIGMVELSSVGLGYLVQDRMLKAAAVELVIARTICSGKYISVVAGAVSDVESAVNVGIDASQSGLIDSIVIPRVHPQVFPALGGVVVLDEQEVGALGIVETFSAASVLQSADEAAKAANIKLFRLHLAMALGGKGFTLMTGSVADVRAGVDAASSSAAEKGLLVSKVVIAQPRRELYQEYI